LAKVLPRPITTDPEHLKIWDFASASSFRRLQRTRAGSPQRRASNGLVTLEVLCPDEYAAAVVTEGASCELQIRDYSEPMPAVGKLRSNARVHDLTQQRAPRGENRRFSIPY